MQLSDYLRSLGPQSQVAARFNVSQGTISHWITGRRRPTPDKAKFIAETSEGKITLEEIYSHQ